MEFDGDGGFLMAVGSSSGKVRYHSSQLIKKIAFYIKKKKSVIVVNLPLCSFLVKKKRKKISHFII